MWKKIAEHKLLVICIILLVASGLYYMYSEKKIHEDYLPGVDLNALISLDQVIADGTILTAKDFDEEDFRRSNPIRTDYTVTEALPEEYSANGVRYVPSITGVFSSGILRGVLLAPAATRNPFEDDMYNRPTSMVVESWHVEVDEHLAVKLTIDDQTVVNGKTIKDLAIPRRELMENWQTVDFVGDITIVDVDIFGNVTVYVEANYVWFD